MRHYLNGFYSMMEAAGLLSSEDFAVYVEDIISPNVQDTLHLDGFALEPLTAMLLDGDFEQVLLENRISVMATYADRDSEVIPYGTQGFGSYVDSIPTQKGRFLLSEKDYRKSLSMMQRLQGMGGDVAAPAKDLLFNNLPDLVRHHNNSMTYQRDQIVSTGGFKVTKTTNGPRGIDYEFKSRVPDENINTLTTTARWFTDAGKTTEGSASNPPKDCLDTIQAMRDKGIANVEIEVDGPTFRADIQHSKWQAVIGYNLSPNLRTAGGTQADADARAASLAEGYSPERQKEAVSAYLGVTIKLSERIVGVEKYNKTSGKLERTSLRSFAENVWVFRPSGNIGTVKTIQPLLPDSKYMVAPIFGGRGLMQYDYDGKAKVQDWWTELASLCAPTQVKNMYYLKPSEV